jgi:hypothetical protein
LGLKVDRLFQRQGSKVHFCLGRQIQRVLVSMFIDFWACKCDSFWVSGSQFLPFDWSDVFRPAYFVLIVLSISLFFLCRKFPELKTSVWAKISCYFWCFSFNAIVAFVCYFDLLDFCCLLTLFNMFAASQMF